MHRHDSFCSKPTFSTFQRLRSRRLGRDLPRANKYKRAAVSPESGKERFTTLSTPAILRKIDQLRELNIGQHVPLPQLVVVGDQSSGKSSLLESLTGIPFPRNVELCTRHATQITSRRGQKNSVEIRILPGPRASEAHKLNLSTYNPKLSSGKDLRAKFADVLVEVNKRMGIRADLSSKSGTVFSEDILKIETSGPDEDYLTVIDVPGIFRNHTEGLTTKEDIDLVNSLVRQYIRDKRTIILAVLPCNVDIATQEIIALAEEYDRQGERTLAVLTKPDLVHESSAQMSVCNLVAGKRKPLALGYYVVRNRGADDDNKVVNVDSLEKMFLQEPWSALPPERVGVEALKTRLGALLAEITRREFPILRKEVVTLLAEFNRDLKNLGPARTSEQDQRRYLGGVAGQFERLTQDALTAQYSHHPFFDDPEMRLITCLVNLVDAFGDSFRLYGQLYNFDDIGGSKEIRLHEDSVASETDDMSSVSSRAPLQFHVHLRDYLKDHGDIAIDEYPELSDIVPEHSEIEASRYGVMGWIKMIYLQSRGVDLGTFSSDLLSEAFREQSYQWEPMARAYMGEVVRLIHHFMTKALRAVCRDDDVAEKIWSAIYEPVLTRYKNGRDQAVLLVDIERSQSPFTLNTVFNKEVQTARDERMRDMLKTKAWRSRNSYNEEKVVINLNDVLSATTTKTNEEYLHQEIHDKLKSYYQLAVDRFVDNVFRQAVGYHLLFGPQGPLAVFTQGWVIDLDADTLSQIVGEKEATKSRRHFLKKRSTDLKAALDILKA